MVESQIVALACFFHLIFNLKYASTITLTFHNNPAIQLFWRYATKTNNTYLKIISNWSNKNQKCEFRSWCKTENRSSAHK